MLYLLGSPMPTTTKDTLLTGVQAVVPLVHVDQSGTSPMFESSWGVPCHRMGSAVSQADAEGSQGTYAVSASKPAFSVAFTNSDGILGSGVNRWTPAAQPLAAMSCGTTTHVCPVAARCEKCPGAACKPWVQADHLTALGAIAGQRVPWCPTQHLPWQP